MTSTQILDSMLAVHTRPGYADTPARRLLTSIYESARTDSVTEVTVAFSARELARADHEQGFASIRMQPDGSVRIKAHCDDGEPYVYIVCLMP